MRPLCEKVWIELADAPRGVRLQVPESIAGDVGGVTLRAVENAFRTLEERGCLTWHRKTRGGRRRPFYEVTMLEPFAPEVAS